MRIKDMEIGETYNFSTVEKWESLGLQHTSFRLISSCLYKDAVKIADVYTMFYQHSIVKGYDLETSKYYVFEDLNKKVHILPTEFIEEDSPELTTTYPVNVNIFELDNASLESLRHILSTNGYKFTIEKGN